MDACFAVNSTRDYLPDPEENLMDSLFQQYEAVIVESLITSFGLDFLVADRHGGDVDTIHNVRKVGSDPQMAYKSAANEAAYKNRDAYDTHAYHSDKRYVEKNREISAQKKSGNLVDAYTNQTIARNGKSDLDHVIAAKEIHDDPGRVLSGRPGIDLANSDTNLKATNPRTNRTKKADSMNDFLPKYGDEYTQSQIENMRRIDAEARSAYERELAKTYYTSPKFAGDVAAAAGRVGAGMGIRQALGFVFMEVWFSVKEEFAKISGRYNPGAVFESIGNGIKRGVENAKAKYRQVLAKLREGMAAGMLASITTTLCNIFFTTAKNVVKVIRQTYVSIVQAAKILFLNPDNLLFGERMRAVAKVLATGASVVIGGLVSSAIAKTGIGALPVVGGIVQTFCGTLVTGIMSCSLLYYMDRSETINKLVRTLDSLPSMSKEVDYFRRQALYFERYAADLMQIDQKQFQEETMRFNAAATAIENAKNESELNEVLRSAYQKLGIDLPWEGDFDSFMNDKSRRLVFQ